MQTHVLNDLVKHKNRLEVNGASYSSHHQSRNIELSALVTMGKWLWILFDLVQYYFTVD
jgi:hypothetical protein